MAYLENRGGGRQTATRTVNIGRAGVTPKNLVGTHTQSSEVGTNVIEMEGR